MGQLLIILVLGGGGGGKVDCVADMVVVGAITNPENTAR